MLLIVGQNWPLNWTGFRPLEAGGIQEVLKSRAIGGRRSATLVRSGLRRGKFPSSVAHLAA